MEPTQPLPVGVPPPPPPPPVPPMPPLPPTTAPGFSGQPPQPPRRKRHVGLIITAIVIAVAILGGATGVDTPGPPPVVSPNGQTLGTGDVQITLQWTGDCDLDLHVTDPSGAQISYGSPTSPTGGALDIDDIPNSGSLGNHIENVFWGSGTAPRGAYQTFANGYGTQTSTTCPYTLGAFVNGHRVAGSNGQLSQDQNSLVAAFTF